jgi:two-component system, chemotaxis family, CheB/CheR fusion protein
MEAGELAGVSVLVVEDNHDFREVIAFWLKRAGAVAREANNGHHALEVLAEMDPLPDVIVCDFHMPGMDGCEFLSRLKDQAGFGYIPVIALTGSGSDDTLLKTLEAGFNAHLLKPVTAEALYSQIHRAIGR